MNIEWPTSELISRLEIFVIGVIVGAIFVMLLR